MRFTLRTLMLVTAVVPPTTAFIVLNWHLLLITCMVLAILAVWLLVSYSIASFFGNLVASMMG